MPFSCDQCDQVYKFKYHLTRHLREVHERRRFPCLRCGEEYKRKYLAETCCSKSLVSGKRKSFSASASAAAAAAKPKPSTSKELLNTSDSEESDSILSAVVLPPLPTLLPTAPVSVPVSAPALTSATSSGVARVGVPSTSELPHVFSRKRKRCGSDSELSFPSYKRARWDEIPSFSQICGGGGGGGGGEKKKYPCETCGANFIYANRRQRHVREMHEELLCVYCMANELESPCFEGWNELNRHFLNKHQRGGF